MRLATLCISGCLALLLLISACGGGDFDTGTDGDSDETQPVPHGREVLPERLPGECPRYPETYQLPEDAPEGVDCYTDGEHDQCSNDDECSSGKYGFCQSGWTWVEETGTDYEGQPCLCQYSECLTDEECNEDEACRCGYENNCMVSCRTSFGCHRLNHGSRCVIAGLYAACDRLYLDSDTGILEIGDYGYRCTSEADECASDYDCPSDEYCVYDKNAEKFTCQYFKLYECETP